LLVIVMREARRARQSWREIILGNVLTLKKRRLRCAPFEFTETQMLNLNHIFAIALPQTSGGELARGHEMPVTLGSFASIANRDARVS